MIFAVGEKVQLRKPHPCGGDLFEIYRVGADIGIQCLRCQRRVMLPQRDLMKRVKRKIVMDDRPDDLIKGETT